jgi:hypothetical protein
MTGGDLLDLTGMDIKGYWNRVGNFQQYHHDICRGLMLDALAIIVQLGFQLGGRDR